MNIIILGAAGFIGTNLTFALGEKKQNDGNCENRITLFDRKEADFSNITKLKFSNINIRKGNFNMETNFDELTKDQDIVYHLISTTIPTTSNQLIPEELTANVIVTAKLLESCVKNKVKKVIFLSSGGTVYGNIKEMPLKETAPTNPISSYGVQKITIEKLLYLYNYMYNLDYRIIRLSNPYGPYQVPNGILGAVTTFTYKALNKEKIIVYGDGSVVRDYIFIDDAIKGILNIAKGESDHKIFNLGSGIGYTIKELIEIIEKAINIKVKVEYIDSRKVDVPVNILNINRYENEYGKLSTTSLIDGIRKTGDFMREFYDIL